ncbi:MAG: phosphoribosylanthranilate isomerase [Coriobacteriales bacterium]|jgi:phosphoribosylanthranilate isomerase|nr:phosphoribosylanthranilate isomerase [Coriobacteriales bacterium]
MSNSRIKICGLFRDEDVVAVNRALPDYVGFVFAPSTRQVTAETAQRLRAQLDERIIAVGVFVEEAPERIVEMYACGLFAAAQLHGTYQPEQIHALRELCGANLTIIRAVALDEGVKVHIPLTPVPLTPSIPDEVDFPLFDYRQPGSGRRFDWRLLAGIERPYFLAGGIGLGNLSEALALNPYCIDVSSGAETDGIKDSSKIKELVERVRRA